MWVNARLADRGRGQARRDGRLGLGPARQRAARSPGTTTGSRRRRPTGPARPGSFAIPVSVDGRAAVDRRHLLARARPGRRGRGSPGRSRSPRPSAAVAALRPRLAAAADGRARRRRPGSARSLAVTTFAARDAPNGGVAWLQIVAGRSRSRAALGGLLVDLRGQRRVHAAGVVGGIAAAASLSSLPVFWHGVVISALPATPRAARVRARARRAEWPRPRSASCPTSTTSGRQGAR